MSLEEYESVGNEGGYRDDLVRGRVVRERLPGSEYGRTARRVLRLLEEHGERAGLGLAIIGEGFVLTQNPPSVRGPDVAFISRDRILAELPIG